MAYQRVGKVSTGKQIFSLYTKTISHFCSPRRGEIKTPALKFFTSRWRASGIINDLKRDKIDLYHGLSHELPFGLPRTKLKSVVTVHDLIFMRFPQYFNWLDRFFYKAKLIVACRNADKIVAMSHRTKHDLIELLQADPAKIEVIYQGCDPAFKMKCADDELSAVTDKYNLPSNYILSVGTIEERKNLLLVMKALKQLPNNQLVVVGKPTPYLKPINEFVRENNLGERVTFLQNVPFADLPAIYKGAACFVYPSRYEGFGIPVLEALVSGVPVIAATGSCLEEAGGPASIYINPDDDAALAAAITRVLADAYLRTNMISAGIKYSANFEDEKLIQQYADLYQQVLDHA